MIRYTCIACLVFCNNINVAYLIKTDRLKLCIETIAVFCQVLRLSATRTIPPVLQSYRHPTCWPFPPPEPFHRWSSLITILHSALFRRQNHSTSHPVLSPPYMLAFSTARTIPPVLQSYRHPTCCPFPPPEPFHRCSSLIATLHAALFRTHILTHVIQHYGPSANRQPLALWHPWLSFSATSTHVTNYYGRKSNNTFV